MGWGSLGCQWDCCGGWRGVPAAGGVALSGGAPGGAAALEGARQWSPETRSQCTWGRHRSSFSFVESVCFAQYEAAVFLA